VPAYWFDAYSRGKHTEHNSHRHSSHTLKAVRAIWRGCSIPTIPNFPQNLLDEHKSWHHARHSINLNNPPVGYGLEFLQYHRNFIERALAWYKMQNLDPSLVEAWASVPEPIRQAPCYDQAAEARILFQPESFVSADELGRFIESSNIHSCIHDGESEEVLYYGAENCHWWLGKYRTVDPNGLSDTAWEWTAIGDSREFGPLNDGRLFRIWDTDSDGKLEVLFRHPVSGRWIEGKVKDGHLKWKSVLLQLND
jgi:hypothetical protein